MHSKPSYEKLEKKIQELEQIESERQNAIEELKQSEERYRSLIDNTMEGYLRIFLGPICSEIAGLFCRPCKSCTCCAGSPPSPGSKGYRLRSEVDIWGLHNAKIVSIGIEN